MFLPEVADAHSDLASNPTWSRKAPFRGVPRGLTAGFSAISEALFPYALIRLGTSGKS